MTSKDSSETKRSFNPLLHEILWTVRRYWWVALLGFLLFSFLTVGVMTLEGNAPDTFSLHSNSFDSALLRTVAVLYGFLVAFFLFHFLWSRCEVGMTLSVGTARWKQFLLRYLVGFSCIVLAVTGGLLLTYSMEMRTLAADYYGLAAHYTGVFTVSLMALTILSYTLGVLVAILCGHFLPAVLCSAGALAAPYILMAGVQNLIAQFLHGSPLGASSSAPYGEIFPNLTALSGDCGLFTLLADSVYHVTFHEGFLQMSDNPHVAENALLYKEEHALPILTLAIMAVATVILVLLAAWAYCRRPAEQSGRADVHPILSHGVALPLALGGASCVFLLDPPVAGKFGLVLQTLLFMVALVAIAFLVRLLLTRDLRGTLRQYPVPCTVAALCLAVVILLGTGWFGYGSYIPETREVVSVTVSYYQNPTLLPSRGGSASSISRPGHNMSMGVSDSDISLGLLYCYGYAHSYESLPVLTQREDIEVARAIHKAVVEEGYSVFTGEIGPTYGETVVPAHLYLTYTLNTGEQITRYYPYLSMNTLERIVTLENTHAYREQMAHYHDDGEGEYVEIEMGDPLFADFHPVSLTEEDRALLLASLDADTADMSAEERYFGEEATLGIIRFSNLRSNLLSTHPFDRAYRTYYVTENFSRTLDFLRERGLDTLFTADVTVEEVRVQRYTPRFFPRFDHSNPPSYVFFACDNVLQFHINESDVHTFEDWLKGGETVPPDEWSTYIQPARSVALLTRPGTLVQIKMTNADGDPVYVTRYLYDGEGSAD